MPISRFGSRWAGFRALALALPLSLIVLAPVAAGDNDAATPPAGERDVILATTTSTQDSGLLDVLVPRFAAATGYTLKPISVGSGAALELGERGEADVLLVHSPAAEEAFMAAGYGAAREVVMVNDFIIVGPSADPAGTGEVESAVEAMERIAGSEARFVSRGDDSGTHRLEVTLWEQAGIDPSGKWYLESGTGMGDTLNIASERDAYTVTDRGTYLTRRDRLSLEVLVEGDAALLNIYHVITVNPARYDTINTAGAEAFAAFLLDPETQELIGEFGVDRFGEPLFTPCAENSCNAEPRATPAS